MSLLEAQVAIIKRTLGDVPSVELETSGLPPAPKNAHAGLILRPDMNAELGAPEMTSALLPLYSGTNACRRDCTMLVGKTLDEVRGQSVDFAHVVILHGEGIDAEKFYQFTQRYQRFLDQPGAMAKAAGSRIWIRCAPVGGNSLSIEQIAATFASRVHESFPEAVGVESWFVVDDHQLVQKLADEADALLTMLHDLRHEVWRTRGFDYKSCQLAGHCGSCSDKKTCQSIRKMEAQVRIHRREQAMEER